MTPHTPPSPLALRALALLAATKALLHIVTAGGYGIFRDELYYLDCARHLDWGYVDQPPLSIFLLWILTGLFGDSLWALRVPVALLGGATVFVVGLATRALGGARFAQALAALAFLIAPTLLGIGNYYSMNAIDLLVAALLAWILARILCEDRPGLWPLFGLIAGVGLLNKFSTALLGAAVVGALLLGPGRRHFREPRLYLGGAIALAIYLPNVIWQFANDFAMLEFMRNAANFKNMATSPPRYLLGQFVEFHPLNALLWGGALAFALAGGPGRRLRPYVFVWLLLFALFALTNGKVYYLAPAYAFIFPAGAIAWEHWLRHRPRLRPAFTGLLAGGGALLAPLAVPLLPVDTYIQYQATLGISPQAAEHSQLNAPLPQHFADRFGWEALVDFVAAEVDRLPEADRARSVILVANYGEAGALNHLGRGRGLPPVLCGHNNHWLWGTGGMEPEVFLVYRNEGPEQLAAFFGEIVEVGRFSHPHVMPYQNDRPLLLCRKPKAPLAEVWPRLKMYI
jgi:4-amino-4-deoxy-L-arabinose transferase-like glycosyltransferase